MIFEGENGTRFGVGTDANGDLRRIDFPSDGAGNGTTEIGANTQQATGEGLASGPLVNFVHFQSNSGTSENASGNSQTGDSGNQRYRFVDAAAAAAAVPGTALSSAQLKEALGVGWWALNKYNPLSVAMDTEYAGLVFMDSTGRFIATEAVPGAPCGGGPCSSNPWDASKFVPPGATVILDYHTHGASVPGVSFEFFSSGDWRGINADATRHTGYVGGLLGTPGGESYFYAAGPLAVYSVSGMRAIQIHLQSIAK